MAAFNNVIDYKERRAIIKEARHRGSMPMHLKQSFTYLETQGQLTIIKGDINDVTDACITVGERQIPYEKIALATGCVHDIQQEPFINQLTKQLHLPLASCGFPIVSKNLEWLDGIYVLGPLAELELGPVARNIIGGKIAAENITREQFY